MSRIGNRPIELPPSVNVALSPGRVQVNGPLGELSQQVPLRMKIAQEDGTIVVTRPTERGEDRALHGLTRTLIANMVEGVTKGFQKKLEIQGVGSGVSAARWLARPSGRGSPSSARIWASMRSSSTTRAAARSRLRVGRS